MSEFQTGLLLIGALAVAAVFGYNKWQEHRASRTTDESFKSRHHDVLIDELPSPATRSTAGAFNEDKRIEPEIVQRSPVLPSHPAASNVPAPDARVDYTIELGAQAPVDATLLAELWSGIEQKFSRRSRLMGLIDGEWLPLVPGTASQQLEAVLQMVSRQGVLSETELLEFRSAVETLASRLQLAAKAPEMREALESARAIDGICAEADIQVAFHIVAAPGSAFSGTKVRAAAEASGFALDARGRFVLLDDDGRELYELTDRDGAKFLPQTMKDAAPQALTLSMDVPRAPETQRTFDAMVRFGKHLAHLLSGSLVDDNNQPLDERAVAAINKQLAVVRRTLEAQGIAPGSALALRLFS